MGIKCEFCTSPCNNPRYRSTRFLNDAVRKTGTGEELQFNDPYRLGGTSKIFVKPGVDFGYTIGVDGQLYSVELTNLCCQCPKEF